VSLARVVENDTSEGATPGADVAAEPGSDLSTDGETQE
jgi:hypothetical protein